MRAIFVFAVVLCAAFGLMSAAEPPRASPPPIAASPAPAFPTPVTWNAPADPPLYGATTYDELKELRQQYARLATKRAERMDGPELKQGITDMRRQCLLAELIELANDSPNDFDSARAGIAAMALKAKDRKDLVDTIRAVAKELEQTKPASE